MAVAVLLLHVRCNSLSIERGTKITAADFPWYDYYNMSRPSRPPDPPRPSFLLIPLSFPFPSIPPFPSLFCNGLSFLLSLIIPALLCSRPTEGVAPECELGPNSLADPLKFSLLSSWYPDLLSLGMCPQACYGSSQVHQYYGIVLKYLVSCACAFV